MLHFESKAKALLAVSVAGLAIFAISPAVAQVHDIIVPLPQTPPPPAPDIPGIELPEIVEVALDVNATVPYRYGCGQMSCVPLEPTPITVPQEPPEEPPLESLADVSDSALPGTTPVTSGTKPSTVTTATLSRSGGIFSANFAPSSGNGVLRETERDDLLGGLKDAQRELGL